MWRAWVLTVVGVLLCSATATWGKQGSAAPATVNSGAPAAQEAARTVAPDCGSFSEAVRVARLAVDRDRQGPASVPDSGAANSIDSAGLSVGDLQTDLSVLGQREAEFSRCTTSNNPPSALQDPANGCSIEQLLNFQMNHDGEPQREIPIWHVPGNSAFFYESGMTIDADGAPNAYHPDNTGLDDLRNAGAPGNWEGLAKNADGEPFIQGPDDPFPGYYVSATALADRTKPVNDPTRYVDASKIPFIVLPGAMARELEARPGDFADVINLGNGKSSYAIFGDVGPSDRIGEGSVALAENLGVRSDARNGGARRGILFVVFPGSGNGRPRTIEEINGETEKLLQAWGGTSQLTACTPRPPSRPFGGN
jgi:hypothetical protein